MARIKVARGSSLQILIDPTGGTNYAHPASINTTRSVKRTASVATSEVVDIDQTKPAATRRIVTSNDFQITGAGTLHVNDLAAYDALFESGSEFSFKSQLLYPAGANATSHSWTGNAVITNFEIGGARSELVTFSITIDQSDDVIGNALG